MIKNIKISEETWRFLDDLKKDSKLKSFSELMDLIMIHIKDSIEKGNFEVLMK